MTLSACANAIRVLSIDAVEKAQSGHPGMPLGMADIATVLWKKFLRHNPSNPLWFNRDRFILSNGHGSMLQYSLLHLSGYALTIEDLKQFRQLHSKTPGHPECDHTPGVETTTGPLGQGLANGVGMALAEKMLACKYNKDDASELVNHHTYVFTGDGCLMEGISHEVCSLAGTLGLGKLIVFYDDNGISIDGKVDQWFTDDTPKRFESYHWQVIGPIDGHNLEQIEDAIQTARSNTRQPSLIICKTIIGLGSDKAGSEKTHGAPLGSDDIAQIKKGLEWSQEPFHVPESIYALWDHREKGQEDEQRWLNQLNQYKSAHPEDYHQFLRQINGDFPDNWPQASEQFIEQCRVNQKDLATRKASQQCIEFYATLLPEMIGGSADLTGSNNTNWSGSIPINADKCHGNYLYYGVREFGMAAIMNGLALHQGLIPYGGTFLVFLDYARNAVRLSALMQQRVIYVFTHDSIGLGEDGPTHQPIEHLTILRTTPNMTVWRPADLFETAIAWQQALAHRNGPSALLLTRQTLPALHHKNHRTDQVVKGAYIVKDCDQTPDLILIATGSEVHLAIEAADQISAKLNQAVRVVSMPCAERFKAQDKSFQEQILLPSIKKIAIEAGSPDYWYQFVGLEGAVIGITRFGVSSPGKAAFDYLGLTIEKILEKAQQLTNAEK